MPDDEKTLMRAYEFASPAILKRCFRLKRRSAVTGAFLSNVPVAFFNEHYVLNPDEIKQANQLSAQSEMLDCFDEMLQQESKAVNANGAVQGQAISVPATTDGDYLENEAGFAIRWR